jgi:transcriptional regulator with PAS, ATPase and Fis domain
MATATNAFSQSRLCGVQKMNETEVKTKNNGNVGGLERDAWQPSHSGIKVIEWLEPERDLSLRSFRTEAEIYAINYALGQTGWNRKRAAKLLSISYRSLLYKIRRHNISPIVEQG